MSRYTIKLSLEIERMLTYQQSQVSGGETLGLVILASDKTHLTNHQGDKEIGRAHV